MTEEQVTKAILKWLHDNGWQILCYDFPQSGTGRLFKPDNSKEKNLGSINPDIVSIKNHEVLFFENKNRLYYNDIEKINGLITDNKYKDSINSFLTNYTVNNIYYGIGLPDAVSINNLAKIKPKVDFIFIVDINFAVTLFYKINKIINL